MLQCGNDWQQDWRGGEGGSVPVESSHTAVHLHVYLPKFDVLGTQQGVQPATSDFMKATHSLNIQTTVHGVHIVQ